MNIMDAKQLADEGQAAYNKGEYISAAELYKAAADSYFLAGNKLVAAEMSNNCSVAYLKGGEAESALQAAMNTDQKQWRLIQNLRSYWRGWGNRS